MERAYNATAKRRNNYSLVTFGASSPQLMASAAHTPKKLNTHEPIWLLNLHLPDG